MDPRTAQDARFEAEALSCLPDVARFALSLTRDQGEADDLVQDTFLQAYRSWQQYVPGTECRGWLFTICRHRFLRLRTRAARTVTVDDPALESLAVAAIHQSARTARLDDLFERQEIAEAIHQAIAELPDVYREAVLLVDVQDQSYDMASEILGVPIGTVRSRLFRARRILQEKLLTHARDAGLAGRAHTSSRDAR